MFCVLTQVGSVCENASSCILYALEIPSVCMLYTLFCMYVTHHTLKKNSRWKKGTVDYSEFKPSLVFKLMPLSCTAAAKY